MRRISRKVSALAFLFTAALLAATPSSTQNSGAPNPAATQRPAGQLPGAPGAQLTQGARGNAPAAQLPPLRASTHLVQINVVVQDKKGNPVTDLTKDDFQIFDQGKPQAIGVFSMESTHVLPASATPPSPNVFSNRIEQQAGVPTSVTVILIDLLNTHTTDMVYARQQLEKFLKTLQPQDRVALYGLTTRLTVIHDFTNDASSLIAALNKTPNQETPQINASDFDPSNTGIANFNGLEDVDDFFDKANQQIADFETVNRADTTAKAFEAIAAHISSLPGRKNLIWVSGGFPIDFGMEEINLDTGFGPAPRDRQSFSEAVERATRTLNDTNVAIYPVDARGLIGMPSSLSAASRGPSIAQATKAPAVIAPNQKVFDTMNILADRTGGRAYYGNNDIQGAIRQAVDDARVTYVLGYYPDHGQWNGKFREIKIKLDRPGTNVRYRRGYFAVADTTPADTKTDAALLGDALNSPVDSSSLGITVTTKAVDVPGAQTLKTTMKVEARDFTLNQQGDHWTGSLDFLFVQVGDKNKAINTVGRKIDLNLPQNSYEKVQQEGLTLPFDFRISTEARELHIAVRDTVSGSAGTLTIPLTKLFPSLAGN